MSHTDLAAQIDAAWERREALSPQSKGADVEAIEAALELLDTGQARVAERGADGRWITHQWLKKAVLLSFRTNANRRDRRRARRRALVGQSSVEVCRLEREQLRRRRLPRRAWRDRAARRLSSGATWC